MCLKLWPSRVLYFIKEWSLSSNFISLPSYISRDAVGVGRSPKTGNVALDKVCCPRTSSQFPVTGGKGSGEKQSQGIRLAGCGF